MGLCVAFMLYHVFPFCAKHSELSPPKNKWMCSDEKKIQVSYALVMHLRNGQFLLNKFNASSAHYFGLEIVEEMELPFMY